jgi:hypothetical protein
MAEHDARVAAGSLVVVAGDLLQAPNDKQQVAPMLATLAALPETLGTAETLLADTGYFSGGNINACAQAGIEPLIAQACQNHNPKLKDRPAADPPAQADPGTGVQHHQIGVGLLAIFAARPGESARGMETRDHVMEHRASVRPHRCGLTKKLPLIAQSAALMPGGV